MCRRRRETTAMERRRPAGRGRVRTTERRRSGGRALGLAGATTGALAAGALALASLLAGCGGGDAGVEPFTLGAIPDQDPEVLQRLYGTLADYLEEELGVPVQYEPVTDYAAAVTAFRVGDLDMAWFGGLTGVQARIQVPGARAILQRGIDAEFHSVFIANASAAIDSASSVDELERLEGHTFTFGSEISTSGRLMPEHFLREAGVAPEDFRGEPGFSGSHDRTLQLVEAGSYEAGALNEQVWRSRVAAGEVDTSRVRVIWRTPPYHDYHWVLRPDVAERFGDGFIERVEDAFTGLDAADGPREERILDMFGAERFVPTENANYDEIERIGREIGKIR